MYTSVQRGVTETNQFQEAGVSIGKYLPESQPELDQLNLFAISRRPLEGTFPVLASRSGLILDISNDEYNAGRPRPTDVSAFPHRSSQLCSRIRVYNAVAK